MDHFMQTYLVFVKVVLRDRGWTVSGDKSLGIRDYDTET